VDAVDKKQTMSGLLERFRPLMDSKLGPFLLLLTALIVLSWVLQIVGFAFGLYEQPGPLVELLTGPVYTTLLVGLTLMALWLAVDAIEKDKQSRAREYASAYEEVANAYKDAAGSTQELSKQLRTLVRTHALSKLFISISQREREAAKDFTVAETALRGGDLARAQDAINRLDSNRKTIDEYLKAYFPEHATDDFSVSLDEREAHIDGESECPSTSSRLKYKELKIIQPKWSERFQGTLSRLEREIEHNRDGM
jgi:hypothetical protein